ncbi:hypothetical protein A2303_05480 [Candidatus Falkowbacteria bacterium RIFOXYB2_FULL_47_14]|uniref:GIY-YIG domain-containing protein n=1 Tax=Candidatus Falkowbacteria bacterium RIFOXYA2_FULL_47_19 TaxID=1797994 RepID=A0A1F5SEA0_9BACT|nr:MAG: hypothetical protein A2227_06885 [Candidatus Falkowbacteria bacterium RIFOXYA2_FULL_47_19]OGF35301.1 MAG: hypothetical protein A2468_00035 [Candidatus Falkowbacteria bacterium RIFOXYC2_FULL_46_15]OGF43738.1 MAG: hypothetical protein A2303_05480 [Candidatus Falkowbacteria bacterium RIFOXYB2_FULL_47_14]
MLSGEYVKTKNLVNKLLKAKLEVFPQEGYAVNASCDQGVYIIYGPDRAVLHIGRTLRAKNGLRQRLKNHLRGQSSFVHTFLKGKKDRLRDKCLYGYLVIPDSRCRALTEALAIGILCPKHLGLGDKKLI